MTDEIQKRDDNRLGFLNPRNIQEAMDAAKVIADSSLVPVAFKGKPADILVAMQMGYEIGVSPMQAIQNISVINGRPSVWGDLAMSLAYHHPSIKEIIETNEGDWSKGDFSATCVVHYHDKNMQPVSRTFTQKAAQKAGLATKGGTWQNYPERMCQMRARSWAIRDSKAVEALRGLSLAEEAQDIPLTVVQEPVKSDRNRAGTVLEVPLEPVEAPKEAPKPPVEAPEAPKINDQPKTVQGHRGRPKKEEKPPETPVSEPPKAPEPTMPTLADLPKDVFEQMEYDKFKAAGSPTPVTDWEAAMKSVGAKSAIPCEVPPEHRAEVVQITSKWLGENYK